MKKNAAELAASTTSGDVGLTKPSQAKNTAAPANAPENQSRRLEEIDRESTNQAAEQADGLRDERVAGHRLTLR